MQKKIKIIIVDDHKMFREALSFLLSRSKHIDIIDEAENGIQFLDILENRKPDIVLMDINMPEMDGIEATEKAVQKYPDIKIITLSMNGDEAYYYKMIHAGVRGFVLKQSGSNELEEAIKTVMNGKEYFSQELLKNVIISFGKYNQIVNKKETFRIKLTKREAEILKLVCTGFSSKEIAKKLFISPRTVENHRTKLIDKTNAKNTSDMIMIAIKNKLIEM